MSAIANVKIIPRQRGNTRELVNAQAAKELIFAVVGPVGSGTTEVAKTLVQLAMSALDTNNVAHIKASAVIEKEAESSSLSTMNRLERARALQDIGDELRKSDEPAVGSLLIAEIKSRRAGFDILEKSDGVSALHPDKIQEKYRVYVIDSLNRLKKYLPASLFQESSTS